MLVALAFESEERVLPMNRRLPGGSSVIKWMKISMWTHKRKKDESSVVFNSSSPETG